MNSLRFIADVHISPLTVVALHQQSYDILRVTEVLPATATDTEILELAIVENRIVLTQDGYQFKPGHYASSALQTF